jgi:hypothetical protein
MPYRSPWFASCLVPLAALAACSAPADPAPFQQSGPGLGNSALQGSAASEPASSTSGAASTAAPVAAGSSAGSESPALLPLSPTDTAAGSPAPAPAAPATPAAAVTPPAPAAAAVTPSAAANPAACASYDTGFLPLVHEPVCSGCHTASGRLPKFEPFAQAEGRCALIGQLVASGEMPPRGSLSAEQKAIVASWVALDCPETAADAALLCTPPPTGPSAAATPSPNPAPAATPPPNPAPAATPPAPPRVGDDEEDDDDARDDDEDDDD